MRVNIFNKPLVRINNATQGGGDTISKSDDSRLQQTLAFRLAKIQLAKRTPVPTITDAKGNAGSFKSSLRSKKACDQNYRDQQWQFSALHLGRCGEKNGLVCADTRLQPYASYFPVERAHDAAVGYLLRVSERAVRIES